MKRSRRWALGAAFAAGTLVLALVVSGWDQLQAWRLLQGDTVTIQPDPSLAAETVEGNLRVIPALRNHVHRFQAKTLLRFLATRTRWPVILRASGQNALETWIEIDTGEPRKPITSDDVLPLLRSRGWRIVKQSFPKPAHVVLEPVGGPEPLVDNEDTDIAAYVVQDLLSKLRELEGDEVSPTRSDDPDDPDTYVEDRFTLDTLKTLIEESTGGSEAWTGSRSIDVDARTRSLLVVAPGAVHVEIRRVIDRLRTPAPSTDRG